MSKYEITTIIISIIAVVLSVLIPLVQWIWKRFIVKPEVHFFLAGQATLYFNQSGSYIRFNGVIESDKSAATIKKLSLVLSRRRDDRKLNLMWSYFISPVNQNMFGNYVQTTEAAHPFRVEADSVACAFVEYNDPSDSSGIKIRKICSDLSSLIPSVASGHLYDEALAMYQSSSDYLNAKSNLLNDFFWEIGKYSVDVSVEYDNQKTEVFSFEFTVSEQNSMDLRQNIDESLIAQVKKHYGKPLTFVSPMVEVSVVNR